MKKSLLMKILLISVMALLVFALVACGGNNNSSSGGKKPTGGGSGESESGSGGSGSGGSGSGGQQQEEESTIIAGLQAIGQGAGALIDELKKVKTAGRVSADAKVGFKVEYGTTEGQTGFNNSVNGFIEVLANLLENDPQAYITVQGGAGSKLTEFFGAGYKGGNVLVTEALNLINSDATSPTKIKVPVTAFKDNLQGVTNEAIGLLGDWLATNLATLDIAGLINSLTNEVDESGQPNIIAQVLPELESIVSVTDTKIEIVSMKDLWGLVGTFLGDTLKKLDGPVQSALPTVVNVFPALAEYVKDKNGAYYTLSTFIAENIEKVHISIDIGYTSSKTVNHIQVNLAIDGLFGVNIYVDLPTLSTTNAVTIADSAFAAKDLEFSTYLKAGNGVDATATVQVLTSKGFVNKGDVLGRVLFNGEPIAVATTELAALDLTPVYTYLKDGTTTPPKFKGYFITEEVQGQEAKHGDLIDEVNNALISLKSKMTTPAQQAQNADGEGGFDFSAIIELVKKAVNNRWNALYALMNQVWGEGVAGVTANDDLLTEATKFINYDPDPAKTEKDCVEYLYTNFGEEYLLFMTGEEESVSDILNSLKATYEANKTILENSVRADKDTKYAGAQLTGANSLLTFVSKFITIISAPAKGEEGYAQDENGYVFGKAPETLNTQFLADWIEFAFSFVPTGSNEDPYDYSQDYNSGIIMMIAGSDAATVKEFLDCGVAVYAKGGTGLEGYVGIAQDLTKTGKAAYLELGAKIGFVAPTAANDIDPTEFVEVSDEMKDDIFEALKAIPVDAINYVYFEAEG